MLLFIMFSPFMAFVVLQITKDLNKPKRRKTGGRGHRKKDYWPHK